jgi:hypothetical protein
MILYRTKLFSFFDSVTGELKAEFRSGAGKRRFERWKNEIIDNLEEEVSISDVFLFYIG